MRKKLNCLLGCLGASLVAAHGQGTLTFTPSSFGDIQTYPDPTTAALATSQSATFPTPAVSLANYTAVKVTFSAPSGYAWLVSNDGGYLNNYLLDCAVAYSSPGTDYHQTADYSFEFVPGMSSSVSGGVVSQRLSESSFGFDAQFQFGGIVEFTSLSITLHYVPGHDWQTAQRPLSPFSQASISVLPTYNGPLPVQNMFLVTVPEPNATAQLLLGAGVAVAMRVSGRRFRCQPEA